MIPKYFFPEMSRIWSEENKMDKWLAVDSRLRGWELGVAQKALIDP